ncbi:hypothetical protein [Flavobacterium sp.]|uniref:hypothetical protein n=1 Tax=Flavobacterium sp. TaxID=239 RepID=UPI00122825C9|nr:hypothetical protein [Flavobacterium sp.]RZJ71971.1 MAG: hypothetical protein EOO49_08040 [Flavobacterium sp.]
MEFRLTKRFCQILFALCVGIPMLNIYELTFAVWTIAALVTIHRRYSLGILKQMACFASIILIAFVVFLFKDYLLYYIIRDITYILKPLLGLMIGYQLAKRDFPDLIKTIAYTGFVIAAIHLTVLLISVPMHSAYNLNDVRLYGGYFSDFEVYAFVILLFHDKFGLEMGKRRRIIFTWIVGLSALSYFARTNMIQFVILFMAMKGYFRLTKTSVTVLTTLFVFTVVSYSAILWINPKREGDGIEALLYKIKIAPTEPFKTKIDRNDWKDFNDNYRSWENILGIRQMTEDGWATIIFGKGIGSKVDLKEEVWLGDMRLRYISILHNGYLTVFLKAGLVGVFLYLTTIFMLFRRPKSDIPIVKSLNLLLFGTGVFLIFSNWVFMGVYNLLDNKSILIGALICYREMAMRNPKPVEE